MERASVGAETEEAAEAAIADRLSDELHAVYDDVLEKPLPFSFGRAIGELVFRDLYPFSTAFDDK